MDAYELEQLERIATARVEREAFKEAHPELSDPALLFNSILATHAALAVAAATPGRGCEECAWGKVAGCWRCGSRRSA